MENAGNSKGRFMTTKEGGESLPFDVATKVLPLPKKVGVKAVIASIRRVLNYPRDKSSKKGAPDFLDTEVILGTGRAEDPRSKERASELGGGFSRHSFGL